MCIIQYTSLLLYFVCIIPVYLFIAIVGQEGRGFLPSPPSHCPLSPTDIPRGWRNMATCACHLAPISPHPWLVTLLSFILESCTDTGGGGVGAGSGSGGGGWWSEVYLASTEPGIHTLKGRPSSAVPHQTLASNAFQEKLSVT